MNLQGPAPALRPDSRDQQADCQRPSPRQLECLSWTQEGKSATDIGEILGISPRTVETYLGRVCQQFGVRTRVQAVVKARDLGFLDNGDQQHCGPTVRKFTD